MARASSDDSSSGGGGSDNSDDSDNSSSSSSSTSDDDDSSASPSAATSPPSSSSPSSDDDDDDGENEGSSKKAATPTAASASTTPKTRRGGGGRGGGGRGGRGGRGKGGRGGGAGRGSGRSKASRSSRRASDDEDDEDYKPSSAGAAKGGTAKRRPPSQQVVGAGTTTKRGRRGRPPSGRGRAATRSAGANHPAPPEEEVVEVPKKEEDSKMDDSGVAVAPAEAKKDEDKDLVEATTAASKDVDMSEEANANPRKRKLEQTDGAAENDDGDGDDDGKKDRENSATKEEEGSKEEEEDSSNLSSLSKLYSEKSKSSAAEEAAAPAPAPASAPSQKVTDQDDGESSPKESADVSKPDEPPVGAATATKVGAGTRGGRRLSSSRSIRDAAAATTATASTKTAAKKDRDEDFIIVEVDSDTDAAANPLILTSEKRRGLYECDYCRRDVSQVPRVRCAVCADFDLCLDCFATTDPSAAHAFHASRAAAAAAASAGPDGSQGVGATTRPQQHRASHGYRVADSTRFPLFPPTHKIAAAANRASDLSQVSATTSGAASLAGDTDDNKSVASSQCDKEKDVGAGAGGNSNTNTDTDLVLAAVSETLRQQPEGGRGVWTAEEDLRLLDGITTHGLGNWSDVSEAVGGTKSARRCMERYLDDFLGRYGQIVPPYTLVEAEDGGDDDDERGATASDIRGGDLIPLEENEVEQQQGVAVGVARRGKRTKGRKGHYQQPPSPPPKTRRKMRMRRVNLVAALQGKIKPRRRTCVATHTLPGYDALWPDPYVPPIGVAPGDEVGRDVAMKQEQAAAKALAAASTAEEAAAIRSEWEGKSVVAGNRGVVIPPRMEDVRSMPGSELAGYMPRRGDFDVEWDNDAETILADMEFSPDDPPAERQLKLQVIEIYNSKLDERERRKKFLEERNLLDYRRNQLEDRMRPADERDLIQRMRLFARFHSPTEHQEFIDDLLKAKRLRREIAKLQRYRRMGIRSLAEAERYELDRARREHHRVEQKKKEAEEEKARGTTIGGGGGGSASAQGAASGNGQQQPSQPETSSDLFRPNYGDRRSRKGRRGGESDDKDGEGGAGEPSAKVCGDEASGPTDKDGGDAADKGDENKGDGKDGFDGSKNTSDSKVDATSQSTSAQSSSEAPQADDDNFDIMKLPGFELLSSKEVMLCEKLKLAPDLYLKAKTALVREALSEGLLPEGKEASKKTVYKLDVEKRNGVIDFVLRSGWIAARPSYAT